MPDPRDAEAIRRFHEEIFVANAHADWSLEVHKMREWQGLHAVLDRTYYPKLVAGGIDFEFYTVGGDDFQFTRDQDLARGTLRGIDHVWQEISESEHFTICLNTDQILAAKASGKKALMLTIEGAGPIGEDLSLLRNYYRLGLRSVILTWFKANPSADGVGEKRNGGLTSFGRQLIREMNRLGMLIDISQSCPATVEDVFAETNKPVIASHSNAYGVHPHRRNLTDSQLDELRQNGGLICLTSYPAHVGAGKVTIEHFLRHIDYCCERIGPDHVGIGLNIIVHDKREAEEFYKRSNIEFTELWLPGLEDVDRMGVITQGLFERGYSEDDVRKIMGGNLLRVVRRVVG